MGSPYKTHIGTLAHQCRICRCVVLGADASFIFGTCSGNQALAGNLKRISKPLSSLHNWGINSSRYGPMHILLGLSSFYSFTLDYIYLNYLSSLGVTYMFIGYVHSTFSITGKSNKKTHMGARSHRSMNVLSDLPCGRLPHFGAISRSPAASIKSPVSLALNLVS